jgi:hypothetical protein
MNRRSVAVIVAIALCATAQAQRQPDMKKGSAPQRPAASAAGKPGKVSPADWFHRMFGIDVRAYANLTAVRGERQVEPAPRLVVFDRSTGKEETLWNCGGCWSPFPSGSDVYALRQTSDDAAKTELWVVHGDGKAERVVAVPSAVAIVGRNSDALVVGVPATRCDKSTEGPNAFVAVDVANAKTRELEDSPCVGSLGLTSSARVRGDRYLDTTHRADLQGTRRDRTILVLTPATGETPTATYFDARFPRGVDRYDPIWLSDERIAYVANP